MCRPSPQRANRRMRSSSRATRRARRCRHWRGPVYDFGRSFSTTDSITDSMRQKNRAAAVSLAIPIRIRSPAPRPTPLQRLGRSATSLPEQLAQHALLELRRCSLRLAPGAQEFQEQLLEVVLLLARRAVLEMRADFLL